MGLAATLCERIAAARFEDLPHETIAAARRLVLDGLAVGAGVAEEPAWRRKTPCRSWRGACARWAVATVIGCDFRIDPVRRGVERRGGACAGFRADPTLWRRDRRL